MKSPSNIALSVTNFLLTVNTWRYTPNGRSLILTVQFAAATSGTVTDTEYNRYITYTAWRYQIYQQHTALTS